MAWFVQPLQRKAKDGSPLGLWHLCAESDEGGGFYPGCEHDHSSAEEAQSCLDARKHLGAMTGFPLEMDKLTINGVEHEWPHGDLLSHDDICKLAGQPIYASVAYSGPRHGDSQRSGTTHVGKSIKTEDGMRIDCVVTSAA